jgi:hypothetical protein
MGARCGQVHPMLAQGGTQTQWDLFPMSDSPLLEEHTVTAVLPRDHIPDAGETAVIARRGDIPRRGTSTHEGRASRKRFPVGLVRLWLRKAAA